jgi:hypothetical protein
MAEMCCGQKVSFSMAGMSCRQKVSFSMAGMCRRQKESVSAWLEYVVVKKLVSTGMGHAQKVSANRLNRFVRGIRRRSRRNRRLMVPRTDASYLVKKKLTCNQLLSLFSLSHVYKVNPRTICICSIIAERTEE